MTAKRFTIEIIEDKDVFIQQKGANHYLGVNGYVNGGMVVDLLNELSEENEQLRKEKECDKQIFTKKRLHELLQQTQKENEHIKQTIKTMMENERTELGQSVLRQLQEAIK